MQIGAYRQPETCPGRSRRDTILPVEVIDRFGFTKLFAASSGLGMFFGLS